MFKSGDTVISEPREPELDAGNQIIHQGTFTVSPGKTLEEIKRQGETVQ